MQLKITRVYAIKTLGLLCVHTMTGTLLHGTGLCEPKSAGICLMTKIVRVFFFPALKMFVFKSFNFVVEGTLNVMLVKFCLIFSGKVYFYLSATGSDTATVKYFTHI